MRPPAINLLRQQLRQRFPGAHLSSPAKVREKAPDRMLTLASLAQFQGVTELRIPPPSIGAGLVISAFLNSSRPASPLPSVALVDGRGRFDPASHSVEECAHLFWIRCSHPEECLKAADLLLQDGNIPSILVDLIAFAPQDISLIPGSSWWRLRHLSHAQHLVFLVRFPIPPCGQRRLQFHSSFSLSDLYLERCQLHAQGLLSTPYSQASLNS